ncbi:hypothetical protein ACGFXB_43895 [Streptomyces canus]|uniref:hypothetical protein n=1 Tax=Streptomyces canus TaxID=58343 RepID=UPI00370F8CCE
MDQRLRTTGTGQANSNAQWPTDVLSNNKQCRACGGRHLEVQVLLDLTHVAEYVWSEAHCFHKVGMAEAWAASHLTTILHGQAVRAAAEITVQADQCGLRGTRRDGVDAWVRYLTGHLDHLRYDTVLSAGWPIATGPIKGACDNGDFDASWRFHLARERLSPSPRPAPLRTHGLT